MGPLSHQSDARRRRQLYTLLANDHLKALAIARIANFARRYPSRPRIARRGVKDGVGGAGKAASCAEHVGNRFTAKHKSEEACVQPLSIPTRISKNSVTWDFRSACDEAKRSTGGAETHLIVPGEPRNQHAAFALKGFRLSEAATQAEMVRGRLSAIRSECQAKVEPIVKPAGLIESPVSCQSRRGAQ